MKTEKGKAKNDTHPKHSPIHTFRDLVVWKRAHELMLQTYKLAESLPDEERYRRKDQLLRSSSSVPSNIAEGYGRYHFKENMQFCRQARGSLTETQNHLIAARDLKQAPADICDSLIQGYDELFSQLSAYINKTNAMQKQYRTETEQ